MSDEKRETVSDIVAQMRGMGNYQRYSGNHAHVLADRIEAAWKREREEVEADALAVGGIVEATRHKPDGNAAAMREALEFSERELLAATKSAYYKDVVYLVGCMLSVARICRAALATPPRNCDIYTTSASAGQAINEHCKNRAEDGSCVYSCPHRYAEGGCAFSWILAPATEK